MFGGMFQVCRLMRARVHRRYRSIRQLGWAYHSYNDDAIINCFTFTYVMRGVIACRTLIEQLVALQIVVIGVPSVGFVVYIISARPYKVPM